jgi:hypothetical protein
VSLTPTVASRTVGTRYFDREIQVAHHSRDDRELLVILFPNTRG